MTAAEPSPLTDAQRDQAAGWVLGLRQAADLADLSGAGVVSSADLRKAADAMSASVGAASQAPARPAPAATHTDPAAQALRERVDRLRDVADRFDHPGGSRRLAQRAHDKADGIELAARLIGISLRGDA